MAGAVGKDSKAATKRLSLLKCRYRLKRADKDLVDNMDDALLRTCIQYILLRF